MSIDDPAGPFIPSAPACYPCRRRDRRGVDPDSVENSRMRARLDRWFRLLGAAALLALPFPARAAAPEWTLVPLPVGREAVLSRVGLSPDLPPALVVGELIRVAHASREVDNPVRATLRDLFATTPAGADDMVPVPLTLATWRQLLGERVTERTLVAAILDDRGASMLCYGLLQLDADTLDAIAGDPKLLRRLYERHSGVFGAFAHVLRSDGARVILPGGEAVQAVWAELLDQPLSPVPQAIEAIAAADEGRLLYFAEAIASLSEAQRGLVFVGDTDEVTPGEQARGIYRAFTRIEPGWRFGDFPFVRLGADPALLLPMLRIDGSTGRLRHTRAFWNIALGDRGLPRNHAKRWADAGEGEPVEPSWLIARLTDAALPQRVHHLLVYQFAERLTDRLPGATAADIAWLVRAYRRFPALMLVLERLGLADVPVLVRLGLRAQRLQPVSADAAALEINYALFQAPLMLVMRARQARALDEAGAAALVASLSEIEPSRATYAEDVARWLEQALLPAIGHDPSLGITAETSVLEALAGLRAPLTNAAAIQWEAHSYRVDPAAPELARLAEVRERQGGNALDTALALCRLSAALGRADTIEAVREVSAGLSALEPLLLPIELSERTTATVPPDVPAVAAEARRDLDAIKSRRDLRRVAGIATRLSAAGGAAMAEVLTSLLYAVWLGDPQGQAFLAGSVARRHDFGVRLLAAADRKQIPWELPLETSGDGEPWHLRGSLLGLDLGLARLALRRTRLDLPTSQPTLNESDRRTLLTTLALTHWTDLGESDASQAIAWLHEGRAIARDPQRLTPNLDRLGLDGRRRQAIEWTLAHAPEAAAGLLLRTELVLLGAGDQPVPHVWGAADTPRSGCLCLRFPDPPAFQQYTGRAGTGLLASRMSEVMVRVLEALQDRRLPATLAHGVLASALQDYLDEVRPRYGDDWFALARHLDRLPSERFDDYVAALAAAGPLVPAGAPSDTSANRRP